MKHIYILLFPLAFVACVDQEKNIEAIELNTPVSNLIEINKKQFEGENMQFGELSEQDFNTVVKVNGIIDVPPENKSSVSTFAGGYVTKLPLLVGSKVKKGQLVARLENTAFVDIQQHYLEIAEQLNYLKNEYTRQKTLFDEKITSQKNYLKAESSYKSSLASYNGLRRKLQMMNISPNAVEQGQITSSINLYAPINGFVTKVNVSNGSFVSSASELLEIVNTEHIHLELTVFEKDILTIKKDQKIAFKVPEASSKSFEAEVHLVGTSINENRTITVHGHINNEEYTNFIVGMFVQADITIHSDKGSGLPVEAVIKTEDGVYALSLVERAEDQYYFEKVALNIGRQTESFVEILNTDALEGKQIVIKGTSMIQ